MNGSKNFHVAKTTKKGEPRKGLSPFSRGKYLLAMAQLLSLFLIFGVFLFSVHSLQAAIKDKIIEKLIPVVEIFSLENESDPNYQFNYPSQLEVLNDKLFVLDTYNNRIQVFNLEGKYLKTIGKRGKGPGEFNTPEGFYLDSKKIIVADTRNLRLQILEAEGKESNIIKLSFAPSKVILHNEEIFVAAFPGTSLILKKEPLIKIFNLKGDYQGGFLNPVGTSDVVVNILANTLLFKKDHQGNLVCVHQYCLNKIQTFEANGKPIKQFGLIYKGESFTNQGINLSIRSENDVSKIAFYAADLAFDSKNNYYFLSGVNGLLPDGSLEKGREIYKYDSNGRYLGTIILPVSARVITFDSADNLYLIDNNFILRKFKFK